MTATRLVSPRCPPHIYSHPPHLPPTPLTPPSPRSLCLCKSGQLLSCCCFPLFPPHLRSFNYLYLTPPLPLSFFTPPPVNARSLTPVGRSSGGGGGQGQGGVKTESGGEKKGNEGAGENKKPPPLHSHSSVPQLIHCLSITDPPPRPPTAPPIVGFPEMARNLFSATPPPSRPAVLTS